MATLVIMPRQGQSVESCVITEWVKKKGDKVAEGDILFSYETDKSSFDETATVAGTLLEVFVEDGDDVPCLDPVCIIGEEGEDISALMPEKKAEEVPAAAPAAEVKAEASVAA
ncbi:MAG: 2-oxo acid dehydrogenase subunit E2, partial [Clostridia bacterium]|nr:2-oxo acid dehydrogenase subunit E2 [Clostridia bacterium]